MIIKRNNKLKNYLDLLYYNLKQFIYYSPKPTLCNPLPNYSFNNNLY